MSPNLKRFCFQVLFYYIPVIVLVYILVLYAMIRSTANRDEARPADYIVVFGAAQYNGRPSPVYRARLDHALNLYTQRLAEKIIITGGRGPDPRFSEAEVGKEYLLRRKVPLECLFSEETSVNTIESIQQVARFLRFQSNHRVIAVSDGFHLFRIRKIFTDYQIEVCTSPAPASPIEISWRSRLVASLREVFICTAYKINRWIKLSDLEFLILLKL
jgi:uncharacterized SAM-binding protein YcdF (DUF218 family)